MPAGHPERAVLRILSAATPDPTPVGAGFLVADRLALTCAHVVNAALDRDHGCAARPARPIPYATAAVNGTGATPGADAAPPTARVIGWYPPRDRPQALAPDDIAVLELGAPPDPAGPLPLAPPAAPVPWGGEGWAFGFPPGFDHGQWCQSRLAGEWHDGLIQVTDRAGLRIQPGYSGGPFLGPDRTAVIGMIVARRAREPIAALIPAAVLATVLERATGPTLTLALDNPLVIAPAAPRLAAELGAAGHTAAVSAQLRRLLLDPRLRPPRASDGRELDCALAREPDLIYCLAPLDPLDPGRLLLGRHDETPSEGIALGRLARGIGAAAQAGRRPLLWLHLVAEPGRVPDPAALEQLAGLTHLLVVQQSTPETVARAQQDTLEALDALAGREDPAAVLHRLAARVPLRLWPAAPRLAIRPSADAEALIKAEIRAALIRLMLGHAEEKGRLRDEVDRAADATLLLYAIGGDADSGVHDLPVQVTGHIEQLTARARVEPRPIHALLRPGTQGAEVFRRLLRQELGIYPGRTCEAALRACVQPQPLKGESVVLLLSWLLDLDPALSPAAFAPTLTAWAETMAGTLNDREIPPGYRILCGACIRWPEGWPGQTGTDPAALQGQLDDLLWRAEPGPWVRAVAMRRPLGLLGARDLAEFFDPGRGLGRRLGIPELAAALAHRLPSAPGGGHANPERRLIESLAAWLLDPGRAGGRFERTVDLIYTEYKCDYAGFRRTLAGA